MMMRDRNKHIATIIVGGMGGPKKEGEEMSDDDGLTIAAEEILMAIKEEDAEMLASSLKNFYMMCDSVEEPDTEEEAEY